MKRTILAAVCTLMLAATSTAEAGRSSSGFSGGSGRSSAIAGGSSRSSGSSGYSSSGGYRGSAATGLRSSNSARRIEGTARGGYRVSEDGAKERVTVGQTTANRLYASRVAGVAVPPATGATPNTLHPSPQLQARIEREQQRNGPGWLGTAALVWLFSQHDISPSDRTWISSQLEQQAAVSDTTSTHRTAKKLTFAYEGLPSQAVVGEPIELAVSAVDASKHKQALSCSIVGPGSDTSATSTPTDSGTVVAWQPRAEGTAFLQCDGLYEGERKAIQVVQRKDKTL